MTSTVGIAGAGLLGRLLGLELARGGWRVTLFDEDDRRGRESCAHAAAGMLAPVAEMDKAEPLIAALGKRSLARWPDILTALPRPVFFQRKGSLVVAHRPDLDDLHALQRMVTAKLPHEDVMSVLDGAGIAALEPDLAGRFNRGLFFPGEGQLEPRDLLPALAEALDDLDVAWHTPVAVDEVYAGGLRAGGTAHRFDWAVDCRGLGARPQWPALRGVRGELLRVYAPEVDLRRPVRLMHPRYPLYIVPRPDGRYLIGATTIESDDRGPIRVKSGLELLSAAYSLHPGFAEARVVESAVHCRPALPDNLPRLTGGPGLLRINGLYRHGFLAAPALAAEALRRLRGESPRWPELHEVSHVETQAQR